MEDSYLISLIETLRKVHPINDETAQKLTACCQYISFAKGELILRPGEVARHLYFCLEGAQRSYILKDKEYTMAFSYPPFFCAIPDSFLFQTPSKFYLESITPSKMLRISFEDVQSLIHHHPDMERLMRKQHEWMIAGLHDRQMELMSMNMEERFNVFCDRSFHLFAKVPHKHIASYLNMDPTNLSKLLNKKTR